MEENYRNQGNNQIAEQVRHIKQHYDNAVSKPNADFGREAYIAYASIKALMGMSPSEGALYAEITRALHLSDAEDKGELLEFVDRVAPGYADYKDRVRQERISKEEQRKEAVAILNDALKNRESLTQEDLDEIHRQIKLLDAPDVLREFKLYMNYKPVQELSDDDGMEI